MTATIASKQCTRCRLTKPLTEFWNNKSKSDGLQSVCKECKKTHQRSYYKNNKDKFRIDPVTRATNRRKILQAAREFLANYLNSHPCADCGESDIIVLQFDHQHSKSANIADMLVNGSSIKRLQNEVEKCDVVCANCHIRRTTIQLGWWKQEFITKNLPGRILTADLSD